MMKGLAAGSVPAAMAILWLMPLARGDDLAGRELDCLIEPSQVVKLGSPVQGILDAVPVDRGDFVQKGQVIAQLESAIERSTVEIAQLRASNDVALRSSETRVDYQRKQENRTTELYRQKTASQENYDKATTERVLAEMAREEAALERNLAELELKRAQAALERRTIRSPIKGVVTERALYAGEYVNEQSHIVTLAQIDPLHVEVFVPIEYYGQLHAGSTAEIAPIEPVGGRHKAAVTIVDPVMDAASGTFGVRLDLPNPDGAVPAGIKCRIRFEP